MVLPTWRKVIVRPLHASAPSTVACDNQRRNRCARIIKLRKSPRFSSARPHKAGLSARCQLVSVGARLRVLWRASAWRL